MRAGLPKKEPVMLKDWDDNDLYNQLMKHNEGKPQFILHDGPPYANGNIHMGTALNKIIKDIIIRDKNMEGFQAPYVPGFDTHGLPIELKALSSVGDKKKDISKLEQMCIRDRIKGVERLKTVITYNKAQFMRLSPVTRANLELTETLRGREKRGTLLWVLDKTSTSMGKRMLRSWIEQPLISSALINHRLNAVESLVKQTMARGDLTEELGYIADMERLMTRTVYGLSLIHI